MPILRQEVSLFPEDLLDESASPCPDRRWWAFYTKPRQEKALARQLLSYEIPFYLPLIKKRTTLRGRKFLTHAPLFTSYLFLCGSQEERIRALATGRAIQVLPVADPDQLRQDLRQFRRLIESDAPLTVESRLVPGDYVRVRCGSFMGLEGTVLKRRGAVRLLVAINFLQQGASVEIEDFLLEPIAPPRPQ